MSQLQRFRPIIWLTRTPGRLMSTALLASGLALGLGTGAITPAKNNVAVANPPANPPVSSQDQVRQELGTFAKLAKSLKPTVVNIATEKVAQSSEVPSEFFDFFQVRPDSSRAPKSHGQGSGVIVSSDGYIITNNHVVSGASSVKVTLSDGRALDAAVIGTDQKTDLALLKVEASGLPVAEMGNSDQLEVGDWVMAIGNPFGLDATVTVGVLSGKGRVIGAGPYDDFLQTDASINPGNSGGPLFNTQGQVVGINTAIIPNGQGIGFSIPVNMARSIVDQLKVSGRVVRGFIGLAVQPLTPNLKSALGVPSDTKGALVAQLVKDGPATLAGLQVQDIVVSLAGRAIQSDRDLLSVAAGLPVGKTTEVTVLRNGKSLSFPLKVVERPDDKVSKGGGQELRTNPVRKSSQETEGLGLGVYPLTDDLAERLQTTNTEGVVVAEVSPGSAAARAGLSAGDIIRQVNRQPVHSLNEFLGSIKDSKASLGSKGDLALLVERQGATRFVVVER